MNDNNVELKVKHIIAEQLSMDIDNKDVLKDDAVLADDCGADSLDIVEIIMTIEEDFDIEIAEEDIQSYDTCTVKGIVDLVKSKVKNKK